MGRTIDGLSAGSGLSGPVRWHLTPLLELGLRAYRRTQLPFLLAVALALRYGLSAAGGR